MPGKRRGKRGGIRPRGKMTTRKVATSSTVETRDEPTLGRTMPCKRPRCCKCKGIRQLAELATEEADSSSAPETTRLGGEDSTPGPSKPSSTHGKRGGIKRVGSQRGKWELFREIKCVGDNGYKAIAARHDEIIVIRSDYSVVIFNIEGEQRSKIQLIDGPCGVAAEHTHNRLVVVEAQNRIVKVFSSDNTLAYEIILQPREPDDDLPSPRSVAVRKDGTILLGDSSQKVYTEHRPSDGELLRAIAVKRVPVVLAVDSIKDRVLISDAHAVDVADSNGATLFTINPKIEGHPVDFCTSACADSSGWYVGVRNWLTYSGHIHHYDLDGKFLECLAQGLSHTGGITFTPEGRLALADFYSVKIYRRV